MSVQLICFSGNIGKLQYRPAGTKTKSGKVLSFPTLSAPVTIGDDQLAIRGKTYPITGQSFWIDITVPLTSNKTAHEVAINELANLVATGHSFATITKASITEWGNPVKRSLKVPFSGLAVSPSPVVPFNRTVLIGNVVDQEKNLLTVEERYNVRGEWKSRFIPVLVAGNISSLMKREVLIYGRLVTKTYTGDSDLYIVANNNDVFVL
jgi:hypothetical protein